MDAGKTTLVEQLLYKGGVLRAPGSVDRGDTQSDRLTVEKERGISVRASSVTLIHRDVKLNIIDTPGHIDFVGEAERALSALDAAVLVVSAAEGVQSQTEIFWRALRDLNIPALIFINKIDRMGCDPTAVCASLKREFTEYIIAVNAAQSYGSRDCSVLGGVLTDDDALALCELDGGLAEDYINGGGDIEGGRFLDTCKKLAASGLAYPLLFGSAALGAGVVELLDAIIEYLPSHEPASSGEARGVIFKIEHDAAVGKIAYIRLFSGVLRNRDAVYFIRGGEYVVYPAGLTYDSGAAEREPIFNKIAQIKRISGSKREDSGILLGGDFAAVTGLTDARAGDVVVSFPTYINTAAPGENMARFDRNDRNDAGKHAGKSMGGLRSEGNRAGELDAAFGNIRLAEPLFTVKANAGAGLEPRLLQAVREFSDEDPLLEYEWQPDERELNLKVMGKIQLEIMESQFIERYGLTVQFSPPTVIYKETPTKAGIGYEEYTMPKPCWAIVKLYVEPLTRGAGYIFESVIKANTLPYYYQRHIELTVPQTLKQGMFNWEVTDIKVTLIGGEHHHVHTHPMDFFLATPIAVMDALRYTGTTLLEPFALIRLTAPEAYAGRIIGDVAEMRGIYDNPVIRNGNITVDSLLPVSESLDYPVKFASYTSGRGVMKTSFAGYRECPAGFGETAKRRGVNPLDRMRWILHKRNALA